MKSTSVPTPSLRSASPAVRTGDHAPLRAARCRATRPAALAALATLVVMLAGPRADAAATLVLDQIGGLSSFDSSVLPGPSPSQMFPDFPDFNCSVLEDFTVNSGELRIVRVSVLLKAIGGFVMFQEVEGYQVNFFTDVALAATTLTGNAASILVAAGSAARVTRVQDAGGGGDGFGRVDLDIAVDLPGPGTYWVGVSAVAANSVAGQFFVQTTTSGVSGAPNARLANPGGGLGAGPLTIPGNHFAYAVQAVPEPSTALLHLLAVSLILARRHRPPKP